jgi:hypothetical protein
VPTGCEGGEWGRGTQGGGGDEEEPRSRGGEAQIYDIYSPVARRSTGNRREGSGEVADPRIGGGDDERVTEAALRRKVNGEWD